ncbi:MAG TPA: hypothetical protein VKA26_09745 [Ignavibacteriaceae bacterium]|nr:hypothetical protein [Ignavibacteriaceae bacterium]
MFFNKKKILKEIREAWGKPVERFRNLDLIVHYHNVVLKTDDEEIIEDKTWTDLNLDQLFNYLDRTNSSIGQQYLFHLLKKYEHNTDTLNKRYELFQFFLKNGEVRENIQIKLQGVKNTKSYFISSLIFGERPERPKLYYLFYFLPVMMLISFALISISNSFLLVGIGLSVLNIVIDQIYTRKIYKYFTGFSALGNLINSAIAVSKVKQASKLQQVSILKKNRHVLKSLRKKIGWLVIDRSGGNELIGMIIAYLNLILLYDLITYFRSVRYLESHKKIIQQTFEAVAELDASISIASFLKEEPYHTVPQFTESKDINFDFIYHPLIKNAVSNSIKDVKQSVLVTGSNMAGKTTFIKTVGINFILAQTLNICLAKEARIPKLIVKSSIRREDDLEESKSYYFVEIERLLNFIDLSEEKLKYLFLIDEIFRGTNTIERLASSTAVLKYLDNYNFTFVTTHDIELQELLNNTYNIFHFSEQVTGNKFFFDYKIKKGMTFSGNAIKLLELKGFPKIIIDEANSLKDKLLNITR